MQTTHVAIDSGNAKKAGMVIDQGLETRGIEVLFAHQIDQDTRIEIAAAAILPPSALDVSTPEVLLSFERTSFLGVGLVLIFLSSLVIVFPNADLSDRVDPPLSFIRRRLVSFGLITPWCIAAVIAVNYYDSCGGGAKVFHASQLASNQGPSPARGCCAACCLPRVQDPPASRVTMWTISWYAATCAGMQVQNDGPGRYRSHPRMPWLPGRRPVLLVVRESRP